MGPGDSPSPESVFRVPGGQEVRLSSPPGTSQGMGPARTILRFLGWHVVELDGDGVWFGRGAQRGGLSGLWWHVARRDILEQSRPGGQD